MFTELYFKSTVWAESKILGPTWLAVKLELKRSDQMEKKEKKAKQKGSGNGMGDKLKMTWLQVWINNESRHVALW